MQSAILAPVVLVLAFGTVQAGMYYHARNVASAAAQVGVEQARVEGGSAGAGTAAAASYASSVAPSLTAGMAVSGSRGGTTATIRVRLVPPRVLPGFPLPGIDASASAPVERVTAP